MKPETLSPAAASASLFAGLGAEHEALRLPLRRFCEERAAEATVRRLMDGDAGVDPDLWRDLAQEMGALLVGVPEPLGGLGMGLVAGQVVAEELGAALFPGPVFGTLYMALPLLAALAGHAPAEAMLRDLAGGHGRAAVVVDAAEGESTSRATPVTAALQAGRWRLSGEVPRVVDAAAATLLLVPAAVGGGLALFGVQVPAEGLHIAPLPRLDLTRKSASVRLDGCAAVLLADTGVEAALRTAFDAARVLLCAEQVAAASHVFACAVEYLKLRVQFGRELASFQALKHRCADFHIALEQARSVARHAAIVLDRNLPDRETAPAMAKAVCSDVSRSVSAGCIQLFGGIGFTWEHPAHLYYKRALENAVLLGEADLHRERLASRLLGDRP